MTSTFRALGLINIQSVNLRLLSPVVAPFLVHKATERAGTFTHLLPQPALLWKISVRTGAGFPHFPYLKYVILPSQN